MSIDLVMGGPEEPVEAGAGRTRANADEFFAKNAFRIVYQTNNFFLPQLRDLIDRGEVLNLRPEYQDDFAGALRRSHGSLSRYFSISRFRPCSFMRVPLHAMKSWTANNALMPFVSS